MKNHFVRLVTFVLVFLALSNVSGFAAPSIPSDISQTHIQGPVDSDQAPGAQGPIPTSNAMPSPDGGAQIDLQELLRANSPSTFYFDSPVSLWLLVFNMAIGLALAMLAQWHFRRFSTSLSNKESFAKTFPFILLTTILIITIVKSSLALSLGLVGALSIVRFRTPIKEPEELTYLFICIGIGLGLGANQTTITVIAALVIFAAMGILSARRHEREGRNLFLSVNWPQGDANPSSRISQLNSIISAHAAKSDLRRVDLQGGTLETSYLVELSSPNHLNSLIGQLNQDCPGVGITFLDQSRMPNF